MGSRRTLVNDDKSKNRRLPKDGLAKPHKNYVQGRGKAAARRLFLVEVFLRCWLAAAPAAEMDCLAEPVIARIRATRQPTDAPAFARLIPSARMRCSRSG